MMWKFICWIYGHIRVYDSKQNKWVCWRCKKVEGEVKQ